MKEHEVEATVLSKYEIISQSCRQNLKNGGTLISSAENNNFKLKVRPDLQSLNVEKIFESCAVEISLSKVKTKIVLLCFYRSPSDDLNLFMQKLENILDVNAKEENFDFVVCGDFNIDFLRDNTQRILLLDLFNSFGGRPSFGGLWNSK